MRLSRDSGLGQNLRMLRNKAIHVKKGLKAVHPTAYVHGTAVVAKDLTCAEYVFVAPGCQIDPGVTIGRYTMLASHVAIVGDDHVTDLVGTPMQFSGRPRQSRTEIEDDVWVGYRAIIRRGVRLGRGSIVAANAVVTKDVPPFAVVAGVPATKIGDRFSSQREVAEHSRVLDGPLLEPRFAGELRGD
ncbi:acyltransferase [Nocardioides lijunqiniae]|uniref:acyltransferase n=1 Tax=Nocardioides lijunqiniae TaxID=2760832 RepID=UPI001877E7B8|nr:DapH/DapD/GlmU-related protein [Nocardioides lijunqiniae]